MFVSRPERLIKIISTKIFPSDQRDQQISSRYDFDQLFPVGLQKALIQSVTFSKISSFSFSSSSSIFFPPPLFGS
jgi:hypothetical protein